MNKAKRTFSEVEKENDVFSYPVEKSASKQAFAMVCQLIESHFTGIAKEKLLKDADGTSIQFYHFDGKIIKVCNDFEIDAVYVDSEIELGCILYE